MSTLYTTGGQPLPAAPDLGVPSSDANQLGASGANAATTPQESAYDAIHGENGAEPRPRGRRRTRCNWWCVAAIALGVYILAKS